MSSLIQRLGQIETNALNSSARSRLSPKYRHVSTLDLIGAMSHLIDVDGGRIKTKTGSLHAVEFKLRKEYSVQSYVGGDLVEPTVHIFNSYSGESALSVYFGLYRFVCMNGLVIGNGIFQAKAKHIEGPKMISSLERLAGLVSTQLSDINQLFSKVEELDKHRSNQTQVEWILDELRVPYRTYHKALDRFRHPIRQADVGTSMWQVYNRIQEVIADPRRGNTGVLQNQKLMQLFLDCVPAEAKPAPRLRLVD